MTQGWLPTVAASIARLHSLLGVFASIDVCQIVLFAITLGDSREGCVVGLAAYPIHFAFQSAGLSNPMLNRAGLLHSDGLPAPSQVRTFQTARCSLVSGFPA